MTRGLAAAFACLWLAACASQPVRTADNGPKPGDGIGGTGVNGTAVADGGVSGDGLGGTGVLGTISGFGSIIVNGLELEYDRDTAVETDGRPASLEDLKVGQVIQGVARLRGKELYLDSVEMLHAVTGPIEAIDHDREALTVLGQKVRVNLGGDKAAVDNFKTLTVGDMVSISGLRQPDGVIVASRVDQRPDDGRLIVRGLADAVTADSVTIGGLTIALGKDVTVSPVAKGGRVFASGRVINGAFVPDVVIGSAALPFDADVKDVSIEAYAPAAANGTSGLIVDGIAVDGAALPAGTAAGDRVVITGRVSGADRITATSIDKVRTVITILRARGSMRPAAVRPGGPTDRPERIAPPRPAAPERPEVARPDRDRPQRERPQLDRPGDFMPPMV
ncbi:MAG: DUF5666 domain-containing protein [Rhodospirillaceae bacterium]|nr:DUF5666 domain-containing protein [Rhodospirillaceae bacterium]